jgi:uncharacterized protein (TIGR03083 family)
MSVPQAEQINVELDPAAALALYGQHRRRFAQEMGALDADALALPSRCTEWTVADVLRHSCDVDEWMQAIWSGGSPPFSDFDPRTTPHEFVKARRAVPDLEVRDRFIISAEEMAADVEASGPERWGLTSLSPVGFVPWWLSALHVFYDSWVHERDVLVPVGIEPLVDPREASTVLAYSLALAGRFISEPTDAVVGGVRLVIDEDKSSVTVASDVDPVEAATLIDALSGRGDLEAAVRDIEPAVAERLGSLARFFTSV